MIVQLSKLPPCVRQYAIAIFVNLCSLCIGISIQWPSPVIPKLTAEVDPVLSRPITDIEISWIASASFMGMVFASFLTMYLSDRIGRKNCLLLSMAPRILCYVIMICAVAPWTVILGRLMSGMADGFQAPLISAYVAEIANKEIRGKLGSLHTMFVNFGGLFIYCVGPYLNYSKLNAVILVICIAMFVPIIFIPEGPYFLFSKGKINESKKVLIFLRGTEELAKKELIEYGRMSNKDDKMPLKELLKSKTVIKSLITAFIFSFISSWCGFIAMQVYLQPILQSTGSSITPESSSFYIGFVQVISSFIALSLMDRLRRKIILFVSLMMLAIGMLGMAMYFWYQDSGHEITDFLNMVPLISIVIAFVGYHAGLGIFILVLMSELFEGAARAIGLGVTVCTSSLSLFMVTKLLPTMTSSGLGRGGTFALFAACCLILLVYSMICVPETSGKSFADIQAEFGKTHRDVDAVTELEENTKV